MAKMPGKDIEFACEQPKKSADAVIKALSTLNSPEEKLAALCKKYAELVDDNKHLQGQLKQNQKTITTVIREKDSLQLEHNKSILAKDKLEGLCRELQRHNKLVKEESLARAKEDEERRKDVSSKFQTTISDIQTQMTDHYDRNNKLRDENEELATKLKNLIDQYDKKEEHTQKLIKTKDLERQLVEAKLQQAELQFKQEVETNAATQRLLYEELDLAKKTIHIMEKDEKKLREQVEQYTSRYADFQTTLSKSNEVFSNFKTEMDKMTKKLKKMEKDTAMWKHRHEQSTGQVLLLSEERARNEQEIQTLVAKIARLESLCRALQAERRGAPGELVEGEKPQSSQEPVTASAERAEPTEEPQANSDKLACKEEADGPQETDQVKTLPGEEQVVNQDNGIPGGEGPQETVGEEPQETVGGTDGPTVTEGDDINPVSSDNHVAAVEAESQQTSDLN